MPPLVDSLRCSFSRLSFPCSFGLPLSAVSFFCWWESLSLYGVDVGGLSEGGLISPGVERIAGAAT